MLAAVGHRREHRLLSGHHQPDRRPVPRGNELCDQHADGGGHNDQRCDDEHDEHELSGEKAVAEGTLRELETKCPHQCEHESKTRDEAEESFDRTVERPDVQLRTLRR